MYITFVKYSAAMWFSTAAMNMVTCLSVLSAEPVRSVAVEPHLDGCEGWEPCKEGEREKERKKEME